jgi:hypothetical protein
VKRVGEIVVQLKYVVLLECQQHRSNVRVSKDGERHGCDFLR